VVRRVVSSIDPCDPVVPALETPWLESIDRYCHQASSPRPRVPVDLDTWGPGRSRQRNPSPVPSVPGMHFGARLGVDRAGFAASAGDGGCPCRPVRKPLSWNNHNARPRPSWTLLAPFQAAQHQILPGHQLRYRHALLAHVGNQGVTLKVVGLLHQLLFLGGAANPAFPNTHLMASQWFGRGKESLPAGTLLPTINLSSSNSGLLSQNGYRRSPGLAQTIKDLSATWVWCTHGFLSNSPPRFRSTEATYRLRRGEAPHE